MTKETKKGLFPQISSSLSRLITPEIANKLIQRFPNKQINDEDVMRLLGPQKNPIPSPRGRAAKQSPQLMPTQKLIERKVPKGEKPNMLDVAGGARTVRAAKGGLMSKKKSAKKSKKAGRAAKRGYGMAKRGK